MKPKIVVNFNLINHIRSFNCNRTNPSEFPKQFIPNLSFLVNNSVAQSSSLAENISKEQKIAIVLATHYYLSMIKNIEELISTPTDITKFSENEQISTNILSIDCLLEQLKHSSPEPLEKIKNFPEINFELPIEYIQLGINSHGKLDPHLTSYVCQQLSKQQNKQLIPIYFNKCDGQTQLISQFVSDLEHIMITSQHKFTQQDYQNAQQILIKEMQNNSEQTSEETQELLTKLENITYEQLYTKPTQLLARLLIQMLGHNNDLIRTTATILLNIISDTHPWQSEKPFSPKLRVVGDEFSVQFQVKNPGITYLLLSSYSLHKTSTVHSLTWHPLPSTGHLNFGAFTRCGFFDYQLVEISPALKLLTKHGRFIVHPKETPSLQLHEVYPDLLHLQPQSRGTFLTLSEKVSEYKQKFGLNALYILGAFERDNGWKYDEKTGRSLCDRPNASPLAVTSRVIPNQMLGGKEQFQRMINKAHDNNIQVIVDMLSRVSSIRAHRKYSPYFLHTLDSTGGLSLCFGTDGKNINFLDTALLNYRRIEVWEQAIEEIIHLAGNYKIDGVQIDNANTVPQLLVIDTQEMMRKDPDGSNAYNEEEIMNGEVVIQDERASGYWTCSARVNYPNPFLVHLCRSVWQYFPNFYFIADCYGGSYFENRASQLILSGTIPRTYSIPMALAKLCGHDLHPTGEITSIKPCTVTVFKTWLDFIKRQLPKQSFVIQSTTSHAWPYPALLYKQAAWPAVDLFFFLQDIPITFIGEMEGQAFREKITNIFTKVQPFAVQDNQSKDNSSNQNSPTKQILRTSSMKKVDSFSSLEQVERKRAIQQKFLQDLPQNFIAKDIEKAETTTEKQQQQEVQLIHGGMLKRIRSGVSISAVSQDQIQRAQEEIQKKIGPEFGFDLSMIWKHYQHRRQIRGNSLVLQRGEFIPLIAESERGVHDYIFSFARHYKNQMMVVSINFSNEQQNAYINTKNLKYMFSNIENSDINLSVLDLLNSENNQNNNQMMDYYSLYEFLENKQFVHLKPYSSCLQEVTIYQGEENNENIRKKTLEHSVKRLKFLIDNLKSINANEITQIFISLLKNSNSIQQFLNGWGHYYQNVIQPYNVPFDKCVGLISQIRDDVYLNSKCFAFIKIIQENQWKNPQELEIVPGVKSFHEFEQQNKMGMMVFCSPEFGRWTKIGGLSVMLDELTQSLAGIGEEIVVVTPFYEKTAKGEKATLDNATEKFHHKVNIEIFVGADKYIIGVFEGFVKGVRLFFLHNSMIFPEPYCGGDANYTMKQLACFAKATLELFCQIRVLPRMIITNDWFCGLIPAYAKAKAFGDAFHTKFFHIVHNLGEDYEGRCYPKPNEGFLENVHQLPVEWLVDPYWTSKLINPSRCAIICTDNWGTVSKSYLQELMDSSPLNGLLKQHPRPFAFPNGIRKQDRIQQLVDKGLTDHLKCKEQIQQTYFGYEQIDDSQCLMGFVGRLTSQKGIHLILESFEELFHKLGGKIQVIVGGQAGNDPYGKYCAGKINELKNKYKFNFWGDPNMFFRDGPLINKGCDFGLMPSQFEPGGIVQHEFFVAGTPVLATKTGGLKDTVIEYDWVTKKGNGVNFISFQTLEYSRATERAFAIFLNKEHYEQARKNAFDSLIDVSDVGRAWGQEFRQMLGKIFIDGEVVNQQYNQIEKGFSREKYQAQPCFTKIEGRLLTQSEQKKQLQGQKKSSKKLTQFIFHTNQLPKPKKVFICGSFDDWKVHHPMNYDHFMLNWNIQLELKPGNYFYQFIVDGVWNVVESQPRDNDLDGELKNYLIVQ